MLSKITPKILTIIFRFLPLVKNQIKYFQIYYENPIFLLLLLFNKVVFHDWLLHDHTFDLLIFPEIFYLDSINMSH